MTIDAVPIIIGGLFILVGLYGCFKKHDAKYGRGNFAGAALLVVGIGISFMAVPESSVSEPNGAVLGVASAQIQGTPLQSKVANSNVEISRATMAQISEPSAQNSADQNPGINTASSEGKGLLPEYAGKSYRIKSISNDMYLYDNGLGDRLHSLDGITNPKFLHFSFEYQLDDKSYRIKSEGSGDYLHAAISAEKLIDVTNQSNDDFSRFYIEKFADGSVRLIVKAGQLPIGLDPVDGLTIISKIEPQGSENSHMQLELVVEKK